MHCKKCLHYEVCVKLGKPSLYGINKEIGCSKYKDKEKWAEKKDTITNADRIRAMSDEELADWLARSQIDNITEACQTIGLEFTCEERTLERTKAEVLEWLKQPAEEVPE